MFGFSLLVNNNPEINPINPQTNIWNGVHGPCPKNIFDTIAVKLPTMNPDWEPNVIPTIIVIAVTGLKPGIGVKITLPKTEKATRIAIITNSRELTLLFSKLIKKGIQESKAIIMEIMLYFLSLNR